VNKVIHEGFEVPMEKLGPQANLFGDLELDSLDAIDLMVALEERTGKKVNIEVFKTARTLGDVYTMVGDLVEGATTAPAPKVDQ
jgi:acyl carrier protein